MHRACFAALWALPVLSFADTALVPPKVNDAALRVDLFASEPLIQTPIGMTFDKAGQLIVIESQTHFRPKTWTGPAHDQIVRLRDTNDDGKADQREVILDQTDMTMDIATASDGSLYLSTRNEILRLRDLDGDGKYEQIDRKLVWLETEGRYPHNGLSGLAFDAKGGLYFGMGENLGAAYALKGSDGETFKDQGEGGNIWHVNADGQRLRRVATGFWNPFGVCVDPWGNIFATDNDPDSSPPCRLHHIVEGGDYGYQFRYGRSGLHPFISWNGQLPGTLPMLAGTGEAPCDVTFYAPAAHPTYAGLSTKWQGTLLVASWVDHRVESYRLQPKDGTFSAKQSLLVEGGDEFRPVAFATAPDGSLFISDWVKRDYELHGKGRVWRVSAKAPAPLVESPAKPYPADPAASLRERIMDGPTPSDAEAASWLRDHRPYVLTAALHRMAREGEQLRAFAAPMSGDSHIDAVLLLGARRALQFEGLPINPLAKQLITRGLASNDPQLQLLALKWISDDRVKGFRLALDALIKDPHLDASVYYGVVTALARLESENASEAELVKLLKASITGSDTPANVRRLALEILPDRDKNLAVADIEPLIASAETNDKVWLLHYLGTLRDDKRLPALHAIVFDKEQDAAVRSAALQHAQFTSADVSQVVDLVCDNEASDDLRIGAAQALVGETLTTEMKTKLSSVDNVALVSVIARLQGRPFTPTTRPDFGNVTVWKNYLEQLPGETSIANGRRVFMSMKLGGCVLCHRAEGIGGIAGPNLSTIGKASEPNYLLESLLKPSQNVAPQYEAMTLVTKDGQTRTAFRLIERGNIHTYVDLGGHTFDVNIQDILARTPLPVSIMPEGLVTKLTDAEVRDLVAYLRGLAK